ncbi:hypothetical protein MTR_3g027355 [Medicago truncatula]|uniref:Uncharacterized protein n=1 Tax=Medicago truncatula TaxID=3880 RepID=A0A072V4T2_MEDTR|nr:hypothetical protein MTR_3g027355 [Medicago truncatula]
MNKSRRKICTPRNNMETLLHQPLPPLKNSTPSSYSDKKFLIYVDSSNEQEITLLDPIE